MSTAMSAVIKSYTPPLNLDTRLLLATAALISLGLIMVASSSLDFAFATYGDAWYFVKKQVVFLLIGIAGGTVVAAIPSNIWEKYSSVLLLCGIFSLVAVLVPGIGKTVNGSRRWLLIGPLTMQASELAKFCLVVYFASYLSRKNDEVRHHWAGFFKMVAIIFLVVVLLLLEPDFGSAVVICLTLGAMMFVAGVPLLRFLLLATTGVGMLSTMAILSPYRWKRLVAFMDPWAQQFDGGYQLVQSLIAFGRGEWFGLGLGNSLQKLFFLPEAHTDFIFAIYAEEFGLVGALLLIGLFGFFVWRMMTLARLAFARGTLFGCYLVFGVAIMVAMQAFINMGVASGLLPTKGLTLPFISYGGSSLLISCALVALVFRIAWEEQHGHA